MVVQLLQTCNRNVKISHPWKNIREYSPINDSDSLPVRSVSVAQYSVIHAQMFEAFDHC